MKVHQFPLGFCLVLTIGSTCQAFAPIHLQRQCSFGGSTSCVESAGTRLSMTNTNIDQADFEFQELQANLNAMKEAQVNSRNLKPEKRAELENYVRTILQKRESPLTVEDLKRDLPGTQWRLALSNDAAYMGDLPREASVFLEFLTESKLNYVLKFDERLVIGLKKLTAQSSYEFPEEYPSALKFTYDEIVTDMFGWKGLEVPFMGAMKGRDNYLQTAYFDGRTWIDRGYTPNGNEYFNVYTLEEADEVDEWNL
mmetsp:Transcript_34256/g.52603  ORF Transcript_34256/g.52603 Transcript_34256/m.52603 type:complete len:254 (+) Transcript_34256:154-915(+)|eukprot:CAMPEP_0118687864 /NCGR_PEP_ID=MMETSP0800-20121206/8613_1 /TAXON_ID=210618 ORGANISM="Striatella unipunctata, Strain CCMP2910" /NCGR_SAMPLE_ID=MMETSP0800 /ASSEMBLY_ACC=CAM_ASM_000638 /LENGTH=253 /DNA_ID=CAMNT_0006585083 /DNA_START=82 /DNA_END=843 /DNA_ORIENTATION=-